MRLWVMENGLINQTGHHFNNSVGLRQACARRGLETRFFVHRDAGREVIDALQARAVFAYRPYAEVSGDPLAGPFESLLIQGKAFANGFQVALEEGLGPDDLVFVPTTMQHEIYGCAIFFDRLPPERRPRLILNFMIENFLVPGQLALSANAQLYRFAIRELGRVATAERVLLTANGAGMADWLGKVLASRVAEFPMPKHYPPALTDASTQVPSWEPPVVAILGHSLQWKGFLLVPELVRQNPQLRWLVQVAPAGRDEVWQGERQLMHAAENVELVMGNLEPEAYYAVLARADVILLPYDPTRLPLRSSGVFSEAVAAGKILVVPQATWMAEHLDAGRAAGTKFDSQTVERISHALRQAMAQLGELRTRARLVAPEWRRQQSIDAYIDRALDALALNLPDAAASAAAPGKP